MTEQDILRRTSRSFHITIRLLPEALRKDVGLAYLVARATDTIADTSSAAPEQRLDILKSVQASLGRRAITGFEPAEWAGFQRDPAERELLRALPGLWARLGDRGEITPLFTTLLDRILGGQIFDLERFPPGAPPLDDEEMERYTWLVAGCVGEFWTDLCALRLGNFATQPQEVMRQQARRYGQGLQLVNILRDRRMDAALGRVYVEPSAAGRWALQAREWLDEGARYAESLRPGRLRYATLLPALVGWRTLVLTVAQPAEALTPAKVPRTELRRWMRRALPVWWSPRAVAPLARAAASE